jgi:hypothetical protein
MKKTAWLLTLAILGVFGYRVLAERGERAGSGGDDWIELIARSIIRTVESVRGFVRGHFADDDVRVESDVFVSSSATIRENGDL